MNKTELVAAVAEKTGLTETVKEEVAKNEKVQLIGFGTFEARKRNARTGKNPQSGEAIEIPAATVPAFKAGKAFKDMVNAK